MTKKHNPKLVRRFLFIKDMFMYALVSASFTLLFFEYAEKLNHEQLLIAEFFDVIVGVVFLLEYIFEWYFAKNRKKYMKQHWFYLLAAIPLPQQTFTILRGVRVIRLLRLLKIFAHLRYENNTRLLNNGTHA